MDLNLELINWDMIGVNKQQFNGCYVNFKGARVLLFADCIANDLDYDEDVDVIGLPGARPEDFYQVLKLVLKENSYEIVAVLIGANCFSEYEGRASINPITVSFLLYFSLTEFYLSLLTLSFKVHILCSCRAIWFFEQLFVLFANTFLASVT